jgi:hypothetical protein
MPWSRALAHFVAIIVDSNRHEVAAYTRISLRCELNYGQPYFKS